MNVLTYKSLRSDSEDEQLDAVDPAEDESKADLQRSSDLVKSHPARYLLQKPYPFWESIRMNPGVSVARTTDLRRNRSPSVSVLHQTSDRLYNVATIRRLHLDHMCHVVIHQFDRMYNVSVYQEQLGRIYNVATNL